VEERLEETPDPSKFAVPVSSINVLVVDDNLANRMAFKTLLEPLGYSVFLASSGNEALTFATRHRFAVILLDVRMPILDGIETALLLKKKPFNRNAPIIFVSAHTGTSEQVSQISLEGLIGYIHSPVDSELLVWKVKSYVEHYLKNEELRLQATLVCQAYEELRRQLDADRQTPPVARESSGRLGEALEGLKEALFDRLGVWASE
jgi:CheY-like chemotaxis protein